MLPESRNPSHHRPALLCSHLATLALDGQWAQALLQLQRPWTFSTPACSADRALAPRAQARLPLRTPTRTSATGQRQPRQHRNPQATQPPGHRPLFLRNSASHIVSKTKSDEASTHGLLIPRVSKRSCGALAPPRRCSKNRLPRNHFHSPENPRHDLVRWRLNRDKLLQQARMSKHSYDTDRMCALLPASFRNEKSRLLSSSGLVSDWSRSHEQIFRCRDSNPGRLGESQVS